MPQKAYDAIPTLPAHLRFSFADATVRMVNGTFLSLLRWEKVAGQLW